MPSQVDLQNHNNNHYRKSSPYWTTQYNQDVALSFLFEVPVLFD